MSAGNVLPPARERVRAQAPRWFGLLGGPLAWGIHLGFSYLLVPTACRTSVLWLHAVTGVSLLIGVWALGTAVGVWRAARRAGGGVTAERDRFLGAGGSATSALFVAVTLMEGLQPFLVDPCL